MSSHKKQANKISPDCTAARAGRTVSTTFLTSTRWLSYLHCKLCFCSFMNTSLAHRVGANSYVLFDLISICKVNVVPM